MAVVKSNYGNKFDMVLCLDSDQTSALANLLGMINPYNPVVRQIQKDGDGPGFTNVELYIPPNYHQELLTLRKEAFGY